MNGDWSLRRSRRSGAHMLTPSASSISITTWLEWPQASAILWQLPSSVLLSSSSHKSPSNSFSSSSPPISTYTDSLGSILAEALGETAEGEQAMVSIGAFETAGEVFTLSSLMSRIYLDRSQKWTMGCGECYQLVISSVN